VIGDVRVISLAARRAARRGIEDTLREFLPETEPIPGADIGRKVGLAMTAGVFLVGVGLAIYVALND